MKAKLSYLFAALLAASLVSCGDETENLLEEEVTYISKLEGIAQRSLVISSVDSNGERSPDRKGEKGRDHRDLVENLAYKSIELQAYSKLWDSALYVEKHDHEKGECTLKLYWRGVNGRYSDNTRNLYNRYYYKYPIEFIFYGDEKVYDTTDPCYMMGNEIVIPSHVCEHCTYVEIIITRSDDKIMLRQPFFSDITISPWGNYNKK